MVCVAHETCMGCPMQVELLCKVIAMCIVHNPGTVKSLNRDWAAMQEPGVATGSAHCCYLCALTLLARLLLLPQVPHKLAG
jgi:hypothetical protein